MSELAGEAIRCRTVGRRTAARPQCRRRSRAPSGGRTRASTAHLQRSRPVARALRRDLVRPPELLRRARRRRAKALYYRDRWLGTLAVAPMILCEAFLPSARRLFWHTAALPDRRRALRDGLRASWREATGETRAPTTGRCISSRCWSATRCPGYAHYGWGYPFDWVTRNGVMQRRHAADHHHALRLRGVRARPSPRRRRRGGATSCGRSPSTPLRDIRDRERRRRRGRRGYNPHDERGRRRQRQRLPRLPADRRARTRFRPGRLPRGRRAQPRTSCCARSRPDGSWPYAVDGVRDFVDHFHTCFVLKALAKIEQLDGDDRLHARRSTGASRTTSSTCSTSRGCRVPFAAAPRLTVYRRELYDYAECINLGVLAARPLPGTRPRAPNATLADLLDALAEARRLVPLARAAARLGQRADASLGAVAAFQKSLLAADLASSSGASVVASNLRR